MNNKNTYLFHVILFSFLPGTKEEIKRDIINRYSILGEDCGGAGAGILFWSIKPNMDLRKNIDFVEIAIFKDKECLEQFKNHPKHKEVVEILKNCANWFVADFMDYFPKLSAINS